MNPLYLETTLTAFAAWALLLLICNGLERELLQRKRNRISISTQICGWVNLVILICLAPMLLSGLGVGDPTSVLLNRFFLFEIGFFAAHGMAILLYFNSRITSLPWFHLGAIGLLLLTFLGGQLGYEVFILLVIAQALYCCYHLPVSRAPREPQTKELSWNKQTN